MWWQEALIVVYRRGGYDPQSSRTRRLAGDRHRPPLHAAGADAERGVEELTSLEESRELAKVPPDEIYAWTWSMRSSRFRRPIAKCCCLRDLEDLTIGEIAGRLAVTREAAKSRLRRARTLVREYLLDTKDSGREST